MPKAVRVQHFKVAPFANGTGSQSWRVTGTKLDGSRVRQNFKDKSSAVQTAADLEAEYEGMHVAIKVQRTRLSAEQLSEAEAALRQAGSRKLATVVAHYVAVEQRLRAKGIDLETAVSFAESHYRAEITNRSVLNAYNEFLANKPFKSPKTKEHYKSCLSKLLKPDPNKLLHTFTVSDIEAVLAMFENINSKDIYRRALSTFFNWAVRHHYCLENPCARLDRIEMDLPPISILDLAEVKRLLFAAASYRDGVMAAPVAIGLFAGLRPSEIEELKPEQILAEGIRVTGGKLRRKLKRTVPIPPVLAAWLKKFPFKGVPDGLKYKMKQLKRATKAAAWVHDVIRHTSISFQSERDKNDALTAYNNGTSKKMMDLHYLNTISDAKTLTDFWLLNPDKVLGMKLDVKLPIKIRVVWPGKDALKKLVWSKALVHVAKDLNVSDVAVRKTCVRLGIDLPPRGHWLRQGSQVA